jgi:hypothetical protein
LYPRDGRYEAKAIQDINGFFVGLAGLRVRTRAEVRTSTGSNYPGGESVRALKKALHAPTPRCSPECFRRARASMSVQCCGQKSKLLRQAILFKGGLV